MIFHDISRFSKYTVLQIIVMETLSWKKEPPNTIKEWVKASIIGGFYKLVFFLIIW